MTIKPSVLRTPRWGVFALLILSQFVFLEQADAQRRKKTEDPKPYIDAFKKAISKKVSSAPAVLSKYDKFEAAETFTAGDRFSMHKLLVSMIGESTDKGMPRILKRHLKRSARTSLPSIIVMMKVLVHGRHSMERKERVDLLVDRAKGKSAQLSLWSVRLLGDSRWRESVDALIDLMEHEESSGRSGSVLWHQASAEVYRVLGKAGGYGTASLLRKKWEDLGRKVPKNPDYGLGGKDGKKARGATVVFFGDRISPRSIFCIDTSTSMRQNAKIAVPGGARSRGSREGDESKREPKIDVVKRELVRALGGLLPGFRFNVFAYNATYHAWKTLTGGKLGLIAASSKTLDSAKEYARGLPTEPGTNIHDTLKAALTVPEVDTIYLLSDGQPSRGGTPKQIVKTVNEGNYLRGIRIVTYGIVPEKGQGSFDEKFMRGLAISNWGWYRKLNDD